MTGTSGKIDRSTMLALVAMALGVFVVANDFTALSVAIPEIEHDLHTTLTSAQWVINGYALVFGVLIVLAVAGLALVLAVIGRHEEATPRASLRTHHRAHA